METVAVPVPHGRLTPSDQQEFDAIAETCARLAGAGTSGELGVLIAEVALSYSVFELQVIGGHLRREVAALPSPYREAIGPHFTAQIFGAHHHLLMMHRSGEFQRMQTPLADPVLLAGYLAMIPASCLRSNDERPGVSGHLRTPRHRLFYYLMAGFMIFVLGRPGHPVGMPFPGGFFVREEGRRFLCPIREKEKDLPFSICNFCPAEQIEGM
jgi:hypothetical protein